MNSPASPAIPLSLYIHFPWCVKKCPYCDFNSHGVDSGFPEADYLGALLRDLEDGRTQLEGRRFGSVFFGGGTPSLMSPQTVSSLLECLQQQGSLDKDAEITLEANPGTMDGGHFRGYREAGVNRLSIGVQSFNDAMLLALGRIHDGATARAAVEEARRAGFDNINLDIMYGLPGQDRAGGLADLQQAMDLTPEHLSWYQLTIEANTVFYNQPPPLPDNDLAGDIMDAGLEALENAGYRRYEVSAFARDDKQCRHNLNYWQFGDYLGVGAGAHSKQTHRKSREVHRWQKTRLPEDYMQRVAVVSPRVLESADLTGEFLMNALRLTEGFDRALYEDRTGCGFTTLLHELQGLQDKGLLEIDGEKVRASRRGFNFLDEILGQFLR